MKYLANKKRRVLLIFLAIILVGFAAPQRFSMPVAGASKVDYNQKSYWYYPWGRSVTHKGVDIFAKEGTAVYPAVPGLVLSAGETPYGGKYVLVLGAKWRVHYYAHLNTIAVKAFTWVSTAKQLGTVGKTGNAAATPPHLHYSIVTLLPYVWRIDSGKQGWKKMFYLNPIDYLNQL